MAALTVEHLKVMAALTVEPAYAFNLLIGWGGYGRAPPDLMVEHLKVLFNLLICPSNKSKNGRAPKGPYQSSLLTHSIYLLGGGGLWSST